MDRTSELWWSEKTDFYRKSRKYIMAYHFRVVFCADFENDSQKFDAASCNGAVDPEMIDCANEEQPLNSNGGNDWYVVKCACGAVIVRAESPKTRHLSAWCTLYTVIACSMAPGRPSLDLSRIPLDNGRIVIQRRSLRTLAIHTRSLGNTYNTWPIDQLKLLFDSTLKSTQNHRKSVVNSQGTNRTRSIHKQFGSQ